MDLYDYIFNIYIKRVLRVLIPGVAVSVSDTRISVSSVSRVLVSCDLGYRFILMNVHIYMMENYYVPDNMIYHRQRSQLRET